MKKAIFFVALLFGVLLICPNSVFGQAPKISESCEISLLTCTQGDELYSCFGHSGIRLKDPENKIDLVFNYGTFDFTKPYFYLNFCRGILIYSLGVDYFEDFKYVYVYEGRGISEQLLNLNTEEKQKIANFLLNNAAPKNRDYRYDFLLDNCATRIRDAFQIALGEKLSFNLSDWDSTKTFRNLIDEYSIEKRWENFGMNLLIGLPVDRAATPMEQMFLPDYLSLGFENACVNINGKEEPFVLSKKTLLTKPFRVKSANYKSPEVLLSIIMLLLLIVSIQEIRYKKHFKSIDFVVLFATGFIGLLFVILWFFTQHWTTAINLNLLWALPINIYLAFANLKKHPSIFFKRALTVSLCLEVLFLITHFFLPQPFQLGMILLNICVILRLAVIYFSRYKKEIIIEAA
jgi:hypothetical protein